MVVWACTHSSASLLSTVGVQTGRNERKYELFDHEGERVGRGGRGGEQHELIRSHHVVEEGTALGFVEERDSVVACRGASNNNRVPLGAPPRAPPPFDDVVHFPHGPHFCRSLSATMTQSPPTQGQLGLTTGHSTWYRATC